MRRMSRCVTGVPLPGWMFSAFMTTHSLPSTSSTLPLRTELAITFTTVDLSRPAGLAACARSDGRLAKSPQSWRFLAAFSNRAKEQTPALPKPKSLVEPAEPCRPPPLFAGARTYHNCDPPLVLGPGLCGG